MPSLQTYLYLFPKSCSNCVLNRDGNLAKIKTILEVIDSPLGTSRDSDVNYNESLLLELYFIAHNNKIGHLFLESIAKKKMLVGKLEEMLHKERQKKEILRITLQRAATIMNEAQIKYVVIKSTYPFPVLPNDVDLLILEGAKKYRNAVDIMKANKFEVVGGDEPPLEICLHDRTRAKHFDDPKKKFASKDPYDVDIYKEIGASYIIYMDKKKLLNHISQITIDSTKVNILKPAGEIALEIFHSIYPERLYTLLLHLHILYVIKEMSPADIEVFLSICHKQSFENAMVHVLSLTEIIEEIRLGSPPSKVTDVREAFGRRKRIEISKIPYLYPIGTVLNSFWGKRTDLVFTVSAIRQILSMANPRYARYVLTVHRDRANRDTY